MSYEDIAFMPIDKVEKVIKELLAVAQTVAILGSGMPITKELAKAARRFV